MSKHPKPLGGPGYGSRLTLPDGPAWMKEPTDERGGTLPLDLSRSAARRVWNQRLPLAT